MHTVEFGTDERDARALDRLLREVEHGDVDQIRLRGQRMTVILADGGRPRVQRRALPPMRR